MIQVKALNKSFGSFSILKDISFSVQKGEIVGFLGENGAGKTTLMRIITSYLVPTSGKVIVGGFDLSRAGFKARKMIGYLPETPPLYPSMTVEGYLNFAGRLRNLSGEVLKRNLNKVLGDCQLTAVRRQVIGTLSKGFKQRVGIAQALIHDPAILILDEPTNGLDPVQVQQVRDIIRAAEGERTVIVSTHILNEVEHLAKRIILIKSGQILKDVLLDDYLMGEDGQRATLEQRFLKEVGWRNG